VAVAAAAAAAAIKRMNTCQQFSCES